MIDSRVSNALIIYICFRFRQDTAEVFRTEIGKLLVRILDNNKKLTDDRESLERVIRMIISETELQDSWKMLGLYHSIAEALESAENKSRMIELTVEGIIKIFTETETETETETRFQNRLHDVLKNLDAKQLRKSTVQTLAENMGYSRCHFSVLVKQSVGKTPHQLILSEKLNRAMRHLAR